MWWLVKELKPSLVSKIQQALTWAGVALAAIAAIGYLVLVVILVNGFQVNVGNELLAMFLFLGAADGILISASLRAQGVTFAKNEEVSKKTIAEYRETLGKSNEVKLRPIWVMWLTSTVKDVLFKGATTFLTLYFSISLMIEGMGDTTYIYLALFNILMFIGFGLISLSSGYNYYLDRHIPYLQQKIKEMKREEKENGIPKEIKREHRSGVGDDN